MADNTKIEWADATLNYVNGCSRVSPGCGGPGPHGGCYAEQLAGTRLRNHPSRLGLTKQTPNGPRWTGVVRMHEPALEQALRWKRGRKIFWNAHGDLFHESVPEEAIDRLFAVCALTPQHTHMILTKRSARMREYLSAVASDPTRRTRIYALGARMLHENDLKLQEGPPPFPLANVWLGVSVEDQQRADERIPDLLATPASVRFISAEPLLGAVDLTRVVLKPSNAPERGKPDVSIDALKGWMGGAGPDRTRLNWVIVGGESGAKARPMHPDWARSLRNQCEGAGVPFLFKQWGEWRDRGAGQPIAVRKFHTHIAYLDRDTGKSKPHPDRFSDETMIRMGKSKAGRLLDGREWLEFPRP